MWRGTTRRYRDPVNPLDRLVAWWRDVNPWWKDGLLAAVFVLGGAAALKAEWTPSNPEYRDPDLLAVGLTLLASVPIALRRRMPLVVLFTCVTSAAVLLVSNYPDTTGGIAVIVATYTVASTCARRQSVVGAVYVAAMLLVIFFSHPPADDFTIGSLVSNFILFGSAFILGDYVRLRRVRQAELEERARRLEAERDEEARRAVAEERARIARELHDVVAHSMSVMTVQAGAARRVIDRDVDQAREALGAIEATGREALAEMRRLLGVLREDQPGPDGGTLAPQPGLDRIAALVGQVRDAGVEVELTVDGTPRPVPQGLDVSAYRIVQEALTNVLKHAGPARAHVTVRHDDDGVDIEVVDDGRGIGAHGATQDGGGHGLLGMRERVALYDGTLETGRRPGGGFRVHARLPVPSAAPRSEPTIAVPAGEVR
jgi:signal transduction histidine kinase